MIPERATAPSGALTNLKPFNTNGVTALSPAVARYELPWVV